MTMTASMDILISQKLHSLMFCIIAFEKVMPNIMRLSMTNELMLCALVCLGYLFTSCCAVILMHICHAVHATLEHDGHKC